METLIDRRRGAFLGLAVGDALGAAIEFPSPGTFRQVTEYRAGGPHGLEPGEWTYDTNMVLARFNRSSDVTTSGDSADRSSGNGSIMRLAPVTIPVTHLYADESARLAELGEQPSLPT